MLRYILLTFLVLAVWPAQAQQLDRKFVEEAGASLGIDFTTFRAPFAERMDYNRDGKPEMVARRENDEGATTGIRVVSLDTRTPVLEFEAITLEQAFGADTRLRVLGYIDVVGHTDKGMLILKRGIDDHADKIGQLYHQDTLFWVMKPLPDAGGIRVLNSFPSRASFGKRASTLQSLTAFTLADMDGDDQLDIVIEDATTGRLEIWGAANNSTGVSSETAIAARLSFLSQNYPNPFSGRTSIPYEVAAPDRVQIHVYDLLGRRVRTLVDEDHPSGAFTTNWDGRDEHGNAVAAGAYFYQIHVGDYTASKQMIRVR